MRILLIGGGSGGHITPLLAVAHELKQLHPGVELIGVCEKNAAFVHLFQDDPSIDRVFQVRAGKYRRYSGLSWWQRLLDVKTFLLNARDVWRTGVGYVEAKRLLRELKPDVMLIKGGFVAVPMGWAASKLKVPYLTHDSDSTPGLANRIVSRWAALHATGMPAELYAYPASKTVYTGVPVSSSFVPVTAKLKVSYRDGIGLAACKHIITITGGSQGAGQLNKDVLKIIPRLMQQQEDIGIVHIVGAAHEKQMNRAYDKELLADERRRVVVKGFVPDLYRYSGAADIIISRASATALAEFALQKKTVIVVPGQLAGGHQDKNADYLHKLQASLVVPFGSSEKLLGALTMLLGDRASSHQLAVNLQALAKPHAARELAQHTLNLGKRQA